ncbi:MAG: YIP1 family protein [Candidatus Odinarchaeota archaeon]|nr:YIP1 family protein [Candidatus Odinarchaeota archaeon]
MAITNCPKCGAPISPDDVVCPVCGSRLRVEFLERVLPLLRPVEKEQFKPLTIREMIFYIFTYPGLVFQDYAITFRSSIPFMFLFLNVFLDGLLFLSLSTFVIGFSDIFLWSFISSMISVIIGDLLVFIIAYIFYSLLLYVITRIFTDKSKFSRSFAILLMSTAPFLIHKIIAILLIFIIPPVSAGVPIAAFPDLVTLYFNSQAYAIARLLEYVFAIWFTLLIGVGVREIYDLPINTSIFIAFVTVLLIYLSRLLVI